MHRSPAVVGAAGGERLVVPDVLRGVALIAMLVAHAIPLLPEVTPGTAFVFQQLNDLASPLFALVMGMSAQLVVQRTPAGRMPFTLFQQALRGAILIVAGVALMLLGTWVAVILQFLGLLLIVGPVLLLLRSRALAIVTAALVVLSAPVNAWARAALGWVSVDESGILPALAEWVVLGPSYRLTNLLPFFLLGALLLRHGFARDRLLGVLLVVAPLAYAVTPVLEAAMGGAAFPSGSWPDTLHDAGLVLFAYGVVVALAGVRHQAARRIIAAVFEPLRAVGAVALSLYVLHVVMLALLVSNVDRPTQNEWLPWLVIVPGMVLAGWLWWRTLGPGPLERAMGWATGRPKTRRRPRHD